MTAQEKAQSLFDKMWLYTTSIDDDHDEEIKARAYFARECAYVVCDEFLSHCRNNHSIIGLFGELAQYWQDVKSILGNINRPSS